MTLVQTEIPSLCLDPGPGICSNKNYSYTARMSGSNLNGMEIPVQNSRRYTAPANYAERINTSASDPAPSTSSASSATSTSASASPVSTATPISPQRNSSEGMVSPHKDLNGLDINLEDDYEEPEEEQAQTTSVKGKNQKRKMKRFRLTHNQTRFLMNEFARQGHPDAAHRERLAREIPGLSPRQVQVWFQNRRAKLKRLTSDDRERMMRSRALPDDFDMTQVLHSPSATAHSAAKPPLSSPTNYTPTFPEGSMIKPLNLDKSHHRVPDATCALSPTGITPTLGGFSLSPPQPVTDVLSPVSPVADNPFAYSPPLDNSTECVNPFAVNCSSPSISTSRPQVPRLQSIDRNSRPEPLSPPQRTSLSYSGPGDVGSNSIHQSLSSAPLDGSFPGSGDMLPYGLGLSYTTNTSAPHSRLRSLSMNMARIMSLGNSSYLAGHSAPAPQTATFPTYTCESPLAPGYSMMSAPHHITSFPSSYLDATGTESVY